MASSAAAWLGRVSVLDGFEPHPESPEPCVEADQSFRDRPETVCSKISSSENPAARSSLTSRSVTRRRRGAPSRGTAPSPPVPAYPAAQQGADARSPPRGRSPASCRQSSRTNPSSFPSGSETVNLRVPYGVSKRGSITSARSRSPSHQASTSRTLKLYRPAAGTGSISEIANCVEPVWKWAYFGASGGQWPCAGRPRSPHTRQRRAEVAHIDSDVFKPWHVHEPTLQPAMHRPSAVAWIARAADHSIAPCASCGKAYGSGKDCTRRGGQPSRGRRTCRPMRSTTGSGCCSSIRWLCRASSRALAPDRETASAHRAVARARRGEPGRAARRTGLHPAARQRSVPDGHVRPHCRAGRRRQSRRRLAAPRGERRGAPVLDRRPAAVRCRRVRRAQDERHRALDREPACGDLRRHARRLRPGPRDQREVAPPRRARKEIAAGLRPLLELPVEHVLATHGRPFDQARSSARCA